MVVDEAPAAYLFDPDRVYGMSPTLQLDEMALNLNYTSVLSFYHVTR